MIRKNRFHPICNDLSYDLIYAVAERYGVKFLEGVWVVFLRNECKEGRGDRIFKKASDSRILNYSEQVFPNDVEESQVEFN